jgi:hypothetical protein
VLAVSVLLGLTLRAEYETDFETDTDTGTGTEETGTETDPPFTADVSFDGEDEVGDSFTVSVFAVADEMRGGVLTVRYDTSILSDPEVTPAQEEGLLVKITENPGGISVLFITDETFYGVITLFTLDFTVIKGTPSGYIEISLEDIVITDGIKDTPLSGVTYSAYYVPDPVTETDVTDTAATETEAPQTEPQTEPAPVTEPVSTERQTEPPEPQTTVIPRTTEAPQTEPPTQTETETETATETDTASKTVTEPVTALTAAQTEPETETEAVITAPPTQSEPASTEGEEVKRNGSFIIPAVIIASVLALSAATAVFIVKKRK